MTIQHFNTITGFACISISGGNLFKNRPLVDTQEHCLECPKLKSIIKPTEMHINYNQIYSQSESEQKAVASLFLTILERRNLLLQEGLPGTKTLDPTLYL